MTMNFPLILFLAACLTGLIALADRLVLAKSRAAVAGSASAPACPWCAPMLRAAHLGK